MAVYDSMKLGIINSAFEQVGIGTAEGLGQISRIGFDCVDIFTEAVGIEKTEIATIVKTCEKHDLPIVSTVFVAAGLVDFNQVVRQFHISRAKQFIDLAQTFSSKNILLVLGEYIWQKEVIPPGDQWRWGVEAVKELADYAGDRGIEIALELEPFRMSLLNNIPEMVRFIDDCDNQFVKANIDISHLVLSDTSPEQLSLLKGKANHVHISDCNGMVHGDLPPGRGVVKFAPYLQAIKELDFQGAVSLELEYSPDPNKIIDWVEEAYSETDRMMRLVDLRN